MPKNLAFVLFAVLMAVAQLAAAEDKIGDVTDMDALRSAVRTDKKAFIASTLQLTDTEAKRFWPIYDTYQRVLDATNRTRAVAVESIVSMNRSLSDDYARTLAGQLIAADEAELKARRTLLNRLMRGLPTRILPPAKAARYLQLESKIRALIAYDIASTIPLVK